MFLLKKLITPFILPPGAAVPFLLAIGIVLVLRKKRKTGLAFLGTGLIVWLFLTPFLSGLLLSPLEHAHPVPAAPSGDVIIVLGGGVTGNSSGPGRTVELSPESACRVVTAVRLTKRLRLPVLYSGGAVLGSPSEASIAGELLPDLGVPEKMILLDGRSRDTGENARYCAEMLKSAGYTRPLLVTSAFHMKRSVMAFEALGVRVTPVPCCHRSRMNGLSWTDFLPGDTGNLRIALKEWLGILYGLAAY